MEPIALQKRHENLTREAFDMLLAALDPNRDAAAREYERIRERLANFFEYRGCFAPHDYADATINCAAKKISEGGEIYSRDPLSFFMGIARNILQEYWELASKRASSLDGLADRDHPWEDPAELMQREEDLNRTESELICLDRCLEDIAPDNRELIVGYYVGERTQKINNRKQLAATLGIAPAALRLRAFRVRERLEGCVKACLDDPCMKQNPALPN